MHNHLSTLGLVILGCITLMGILVSQLFGLRESLTTNNLEDAIQSRYTQRETTPRALNVEHLLLIKINLRKTCLL